MPSFRSPRLQAMKMEYAVLAPTAGTVRSIKVAQADISQMDFQAFFDNLSNQQRAEIRSRCSVIGSDGRFAQWVRDLCVKVLAAQNRG